MDTKSIDPLLILVKGWEHDRNADGIHSSDSCRRCAFIAAIPEHDAALISATLGCAAEILDREAEGALKLENDPQATQLGQRIACTIKATDLENARVILAITPDAVAAWQAEKGRQSQ